MVVLRNVNLTASPKEGPYDTFVAGLLGGYVVFGRNSGSISQQVRIALQETMSKEVYLEVKLTILSVDRDLCVRESYACPC